MRVARALLGGGFVPLALVAASVLTQRLLLPFAVLHLQDRTAAIAALLGAAALGFVRTRGADRLARVVRFNVLELHLATFVRGPVAALPSAEAITARLTTDLPLLTDWAVDGVALVVAASVAIPAVIAILLGQMGLRVLLPIAVAGLVGAATMIAASKRVTRTWTASWARARTLIRGVTSGYEGAIDLRAHGRAEAYAEGLRGDLRAWCEAEAKAHVASTISTWGAFGATLAGAAFIVALSGGAFAPEGDPYRTSLLLLAAVPTLHTLVSGVSHLLAAREALGVARELSNATSAPEGLLAGEEALDATATIRLEGIGYAYPARGERDPWRTPGESFAPVVALDGVDLVLPPARSVAILGPNGAGKTTLAHVLLGILPPDRGRTLVGEKEARLDNAGFRARIAYLAQSPFQLRDGTIAENLRALDARATDAQLLAALATVGLLDVLRARTATGAAILGLPYRALSRGQARRVMLARALLRDADLLVLDEPEAHLDAASATELSAILTRVAKDKRVVAIVHDTRLVEFADQVVELSPPAVRLP